MLSTTVQARPDKLRTTIIGQSRCTYGSLAEGACGTTWAGAKLLGSVSASLWTGARLVPSLLYVAMSGQEVEDLSDGLRPGRLQLRVGVAVREGLIEAMSSIIGYAIESASDVREDRVRAVHEFRKSTRRARAVLALCRAELEDDDFQTLWGIMRDAAKATSKLRDRDVFPDVLEAFPVTGPLEVVAEDVKAALSVTSTPLDDVEQVLVSGAHVLSSVPVRFDVALPEHVDWSALERGLCNSYRLVRRALKRARGSRRFDAFHDWRKRTKELGYQLELLTSGYGGDVGALHVEVSGLARELGGITDRVNLARHLRKNAKGKHGRRLARAVRKDAKRSMAKSLARGRKVFWRKPKRFARRAMKRILSDREELGSASTT